MAIKVSQAFERTSANPIDVTLALSKAQMKTVNDNTMPSKYFTSCQDDGYLYLYDKSNEVDETTGKYRKFEGGSGEQIQFNELPTPSSTLSGVILQFTGVTDVYTNGYFYKCTEDNGDYSWVQHNVQPSSSGGTTDYSDLTNKPSVNSVTLSGNKTSSDLGLQDVIQVTTLPEASASNVGAVLHYVGVTENGLIHNYFYECVSDGEPTPAYSWVQKNVQPDVGTTDYSDLSNKPSVNSVTLSGNKTSADLGLQDIIQLVTMPSPISAYLGRVVQYIGASDATYTKGYFYECTSDGEAEPTYSWTQKNVQPSEGGGTSDYEELTNKPQVAGVTLIGNKSLADLGIQGVVQVSSLPEITASMIGTVYQYIGATENGLTHNYFYEATTDGEAEPTYSWVQKNVQPDNGTDDYSDLNNKPSVNSVTLSGNKTSSDLGLQDVMQVTELPTPSASNEGKVYQFLGTTGTYTSGYFYRCESDEEAEPTYSWVQLSVQPASSGGDASLQSAVTANLTVGAISSGTTIAKDTTFTEFVQKLLITEIAPTTTFTASGSGVKEVGTSVTPTLTLTITGTGTGTPTSIKFYDGSTLLDTQAYASGTNTYTYTMSAVTTTKTVKGVLEYTKSDGTTTASIEKSASYTFVMASYYGAVATAPTDKAGITALTKNVKNTKALTATFSLSNQRSCYCYPASFGNLTSIKDGNGFEYISGYTKTTVAVDGVDYNVYTQTDPVTATGFKQIYS